MALFGKKKLSLEEILKGIAALSEEEQAQILSAMQEKTVEQSSGSNENVTENDDVTETGEETTEHIEDTTENGEEATENTAAPENEENESLQEEAQNTSENPVEETESGENVDPPAPMAETPTETPQAEPMQTEETPQGPNYDELLAAQNVRIASLESQLAAFKETLENVVTNQDKQNFGYSPKAHFDENVDSSRMDAVMQGYAPRRADQYK